MRCLSKFLAGPQMKCAFLDGIKKSEGVRPEFCFQFLMMQLLLVILCCFVSLSELDVWYSSQNSGFLIQCCVNVMQHLFLEAEIVQWPTISFLLYIALLVACDRSCKTYVVHTGFTQEYFSFKKLFSRRTHLPTESEARDEISEHIIMNTTMVWCYEQECITCIASKIYCPSHLPLISSM